LQGQADAAACLERDWEDFITSYDFPEEHWVHLRTTNPIESVFSGVRLRTNGPRACACAKAPSTWCSSWSPVSA
jgi:putative transposase